MASLTVRNIEDDVKSALRLRAARKGVSVESEVRDILRAAAREETSLPPESEAERKARVARILALGKPPLEPFDLKALSDELSAPSEGLPDGSEKLPDGPE